MAKSRYLYEVLIRGSADGKISGAHQIWNEVYTDDDTDEVITTKEGMAQVLNVSDVAALVGESFAGLAAQLQQTQIELASTKLAASETENRLLVEITALRAATENDQTADAAAKTTAPESVADLGR